MRPIASKLVFLSVFKLIETICPNILAKPLKQESKVSTFGRRASLKSVLITLSAWNYILVAGVAAGSSSTVFAVVLTLLCSLATGWNCVDVCIPWKKISRFSNDNLRSVTTACAPRS